MTAHAAEYAKKWTLWNPREVWDEMERARRVKELLNDLNARILPTNSGEVAVHLCDCVMNDDRFYLPADDPFREFLRTIYLEADHWIWDYITEEEED
jgi:hypothetical protein